MNDMNEIKIIQRSIHFTIQLFQCLEITRSYINDMALSF